MSVKTIQNKEDAAAFLRDKKYFIRDGTFSFGDGNGTGTNLTKLDEDCYEVFRYGIGWKDKSPATLDFDQAVEFVHNHQDDINRSLELEGY